MANTIPSGNSGGGVRNAGFDAGAKASAKGVENATAGVGESSAFEDQVEKATRNENHNKLTEQFLQKVEKNRLESAGESIKNMV